MPVEQLGLKDVLGLARFLLGAGCVIASAAASFSGPPRDAMASIARKWWTLKR
jgi:hypothetical protein